MKRVAYVGGHEIPPFNRPWGGTMATNYCYQKAFAGDPEYAIDLLPRNHCTPETIKAHIAGADIVHLDDTSVCAMMFEAGMEPPDVIGPITRSPVKDYKGWTCPYPTDWFYRAKVIRLNHAEERDCPERVTLVAHGVDAELLKPTPGRKSVVLWAGDAKRSAKNYELWREIKPNKPEWKTLSHYNVEDYWEALKETAVLVNTSRYESFCCAAFEAMACGVPVVWRKGLQGGLHEKAGMRVDYNADDYFMAIFHVYTNREEYSRQARQYVEDHCTLKHMRDSYAKVFKEATK